MTIKHFLHQNWKFRISGKTKDQILPPGLKLNSWFNAAVPGTVHTDLLENNLIPDPFFGDNEISLEWIAENNWHYANEFSVPKEFDLSKKIYLIFEGIDTHAAILLNGKTLSIVSNMFCKFVYEVSALLKNKSNKIDIIFNSPLKTARSLEDQYGKLPVALNSSRVYIRKAQYSFGWDWGPSFPTSGVWRPLYLLQNNDGFISGFNFQTLSIDEIKAEVRVSAEVNGFENINYAHITVSNKDRKFDKKVIVDSSLISSDITISSPDLWWPNGLGDQDLYDVSIELFNKDNEQVDIQSFKAGIRTIELILEDNGKPSFKFLINKTPFFAKGANWIPADSFLPRISKDRYKQNLTLAKEANMNIIRVWGGGIYEDDYFYELCDELGLLVWQDFMFACASYPEHKEFIDSVKEEAVQNIKRLRYHPSLAVWCGNNENEWIWFQEQKRPYKEMPGFSIYGSILPALLKELDPLRPYWESSPFSNEDDPNSPLSGNRHQWDIWSRFIDYKTVKYDTSLFVTEFGFQSPANYETLVKVLPEEEAYTQSRSFEFHNKQVEGPERLFKFLSGHLPVRTKTKDFIYLTQLNHGFAMKECLEHWRLRYPKTNGSIIWQLNDCWPVSSWALVDSELTPKLPYYFVRRAFNNLLTAFEDFDNHIHLSISNSAKDIFIGFLKVELVSLPKGKVKRIEIQKLTAGQESKQYIFSFEYPEENALLLSTVYDEKKNIISRNYYLRSEWKHVNLPDPKLTFDFIKNNGQTFIEVKVKRPAFFVYFENPQLLFKDNGIIVLPGEAAFIPIEHNAKFKKSNTQFKTLNDYLQ